MGSKFTFSDIPARLDYVHGRGHEGDIWEAHRYWPSATPFGIGATVDFLIRPSGSSAHMIISYDTAGNFEGYFYRAPTISAVGTPMVANNINDYMTPDSNKVFIYEGPTNSALGTLWVPFMAIGGTRSKAQGSSTGFDNERILKDGVDYLFRLKNVSAATSMAQLDFIWYEPS